MCVCVCVCMAFMDLVNAIVGQCKKHIWIKMQISLRKFNTIIVCVYFVIKRLTTTKNEQFMLNNLL